MNTYGSYLGREEPDVIGWVVVERTDLPAGIVAGHGRFRYNDCLLGMLPDRNTLVCAVAYECYEEEHQSGGLSADTNYWVTNYDYYRVRPRDVSPAALEKLKKSVR